VNGNLLEIGFWQPLLVRTVSVGDEPTPIRILYISDIHLRPHRSKRLCDQILVAARSAAPDVVLLGGDLTDRRSELHHLSVLVTQLRQLAPVLVVAGNHDLNLGVSLVREAVDSGGGMWIHDSMELISHGSRVISIAGPDYRTEPEDREEAGRNDVRILCAHNPRIWKTARDQSFDLVLAGHLHGCQFVAFEYHDRLYPGAWFYPYCYLNHRGQRSMLVVSRGVSDLIPIRWRCPREVVLCLV
jgi:predicted MPP superfamily phosphohydrolase